MGHGFARLLALVLLLQLSAWHPIDGSTVWFLNQATGAIGPGPASRTSFAPPLPDGTTFLDLTWSLDGDGLCKDGPSSHGPHSTTAWPPPNPVLSVTKPQITEPYLTRAESWSPVFVTSTDATLNLFKNEGGQSHQGFFSWGLGISVNRLASEGSGSGVNSLGAEACACGVTQARACRACESKGTRQKGGRVTGQKLPPRSAKSGTVTVSPAGSVYSTAKRSLAAAESGSPRKRVRLGRARPEWLTANNPTVNFSGSLHPRHVPTFAKPLDAVFSDSSSDFDLDSESELSGLFEAYGGLDSAQTLLERSVKLNPRDPSLWNDLGNVHRALGRAGLAAECFRIGIESQPHPDLFLNLGSVVFRAGHWNEAQEIFEAGLRLDGRHALLLFSLASTHAALGHPDDAARWFDELSVVHPGFADAALPHRSILFQRLRSSKQLQGALLLSGLTALLACCTCLRTCPTSAPKPHPAVHRILHSPTGSKRKKRL